MPKEQGASRRADEPRAEANVGDPVGDRLDQARDVTGIVFKIGVLDDDDLARGPCEARAQGGALAHVPRLKDDLGPVVTAHGRPGGQPVNQGLGVERGHQLAAAVRGAVVDENQLLVEVDGDDAPHQLLHGGDFVEQRDHERDLHAVTES